MAFPSLPWCYRSWTESFNYGNGARHTYTRTEPNLAAHALVAAFAVFLCWWGVRMASKALVNLGVVGFAVAVAWFYFSNIFDKMGRSLGLIGLGDSLPCRRMGFGEDAKAHPGRHGCDPAAALRRRNEALQNLGRRLLLIQLAIVSSVAAKYLYQRWTCPRVWTRTVAFDPELPMRGRYLSLQLIVDGCQSTLPSAKGRLSARHQRRSSPRPIRHTRWRERGVSCRIECCQ